jgi:hypothetical protein
VNYAYVIVTQWYSTNFTNITGAFSNDFVPNINCKYNIMKGIFLLKSYYNQNYYKYKIIATLLTKWIA